MSLYGKFDLTGVKDGDPEPCPRVWDTKRLKWSDDWKLNLFENELSSWNAKYETMMTRLSEQLHDPKTLMDIADFGIENPLLATNAIAEILEQCYKSDKYKTMVTVDNLNTWYQPSGFISFRYENERGLRGFIPPHDLALCRLFIRFDGQFIRNGVKLMATSHYH